MRRIAIVLAILAACLVGWLLLRGAPAPAARAPASTDAPAPADVAPSHARAGADAAAEAAPGAQRHLAVKVVDAGGRPRVGVDVRLRTDDAEWPFRLESTGVDGLAHFGDVTADPAEDSKTGALSAVLPLATRLTARVGSAALRSEPVLLVLPATGRVRVEVVSGAVGATDGDFTVDLRVAGDDARHPVELLAPERVVRFPYVGLGLQLEVDVSPSSRRGKKVTTRFAGPAQAGEQTAVRVTIGADWPVIAGRIVDAAGAPLRQTKFVADLVEPGADRTPTDGVTDEKGRFAVAFDREPGASEGVKLQMGHHVMGMDGRTTTRVDALVDLPTHLPAGQTDVGDVVVRSRGVVVAGVVVDAAGAPIVSAVVRVMDEWPWGRSHARYVDAARTDAEGRFRLEGSVDRPEVLVGVGMPGYYVPERAAFAPGTTDARIVMHRAGGISGTIRIPGGMAMYQVKVLVLGEPQRNGDCEWRGEGLVRHRQDEPIEFDTLRPGRARVEVRFMDEVVLAFDDVEVVGGEITRDPRLQDIDPAKGMRQWWVEVVDGERRRVEGWVHARPGGRRGTWIASLAQQGVAVVHAPADVAALDLVVMSWDHRATTASAVSPNTTVVVEDAKPVAVRVRLADTTSVPPEGFQLYPWLVWAGPGTDGDTDAPGDPRDVHTGEGQFEAGRVVTFETRTPGRYRVRLSLSEMTYSGMQGGAIGTHPAEVFVTVGADPVEVVVGVDPEEMKERTGGE